MKANRSNIAVFLDRDGTLNDDSGYVRTPQTFNIFPDTGPALARLNQAGLWVIIITNQSGIARGYFSYQELHQIHEKLHMELKKIGAWIDEIFVCPHHPDDGCRCRKPQPGLLEEASQRFNIDLERSYMVGDKILDIQVANQVGAKGVLVLSGPASEEAVRANQLGEVKVHCTVKGIKEAVDWILKNNAQESIEMS